MTIEMPGALKVVTRINNGIEEKTLLALQSNIYQNKMMTSRAPTDWSTVIFG
jgi:hypothetical protein